jgi:hypothetical protein
MEGFNNLPKVTRSVCGRARYESGQKGSRVSSLPSMLVMQGTSNGVSLLLQRAEICCILCSLETYRVTLFPIPEVGLSATLLI